MTISTLSSELACVECGVNCSRPVSSYSCLQAKNKKHEKRTSETYFSNSRAALDSNEALQLPLRASASSIALESGGLRLARFDIDLLLPHSDRAQYKSSSTNSSTASSTAPSRHRLHATSGTGRALPCWNAANSAMRVFVFRCSATFV